LESDTKEGDSPVFKIQAAASRSLSNSGHV
jgi:hypothetical protein